MAVKKSLKLNFVMNVILTMSSIVFPLITFPYASRILLPEGMGRVSFATSVIAYFNMLAQLGIPTYGIRACAKVRDNKLKLSQTVQEILTINLITTLMAYAALAFALTFMSRLYDDRELYIIVSASIIFNTIGMEWFYKALEQYTYITIRSLIFKIIAVIAMFMLVRESADYKIYGGITIFAASASNIFNFINVHRFVDFGYRCKFDLSNHIKPILVFFGMSCATIIYLNMDTVMLGFMKSDIDVGYYNTAVKIKTILVSVVTSLGAVLLPRCAYYVEKGLIEEFHRICKKALNFVFIIAAPLMVYFIIYAAQSIRFLSGPAYDEAVVPMQIIMPTLLFIGLSNILGIQVLIPLGKEKIVLISEIAGAAIDLVINYLLIPKYASIGAAFGTTVAEAVVLAIQCFALRGDLSELLSNIKYWKTIVAVSLGALFSVLVVSEFNYGAFITLIISSICFFGMYAIIMLATKEYMAMELFDTVMQTVTTKMRGKND